MRKEKLSGGWLPEQYGIPSILAIRASVMIGWAIAVYIFALVGHLALALVFTEHTDPCNFNHESANNGLGWSIAGLTVGNIVFFGLWLRKYLTIFWVLICGAYQAYSFVEIILNWREC